MRIPGKPNIEIEADRVIKTGDPRLLAIEAEKTRRAREIGQASGLFRVPSVLSFEPESRRLVLERLHHIVPLSHVLTADCDWRRILVRVGHCLAAIHDHLDLPETMLKRWPDRWWFSAGTGAVLHGDFNYSNVQIDQTDGSPVILDWSATPGLAADETLGPREYDIGWFLRGLFFSRFFTGRRWRFLTTRVRRQGAAFVTGYFERTGYRPAEEEFSRHLDHIGREILRSIDRSRMRPWARAEYLMIAARYARYIRGESFRRLCRKSLSG